jgi:hypothetical protein
VFEYVNHANHVDRRNFGDIVLNIKSLRFKLFSGPSWFHPTDGPPSCACAFKQSAGSSSEIAKTPGAHESLDNVQADLRVRAEHRIVAIIAISIVEGGQLPFGGTRINEAYFASRAPRQATGIVKHFIPDRYWWSRNLVGLASAQVTDR